MKITIENYTEHCLKTWGGENQRERAELGIIGELGEVSEVLKKSLRGDFDEIERNKRLLKELGDVCYYIAIECFEVNTTIYNLYRKCSTLTHDHHTVFYTVNKFSDYIFNKNHETLCELIEAFEFMCSFYGFTLEQVMQANIEKLSSRAKRDVISGDGDNR